MVNWLYKANLLKNSGITRDSCTCNVWYLKMLNHCFIPGLTDQKCLLKTRSPRRVRVRSRPKIGNPLRHRGNGRAAIMPNIPSPRSIGQMYSGCQPGDAPTLLLHRRRTVITLNHFLYIRVHSNITWHSWGGRGGRSTKC